MSRAHLPRSYLNLLQLVESIVSPTLDSLARELALTKGNNSGAVGALWPRLKALLYRPTGLSTNSLVASSFIESRTLLKLRPCKSSH